MKLFRDFSLKAKLNLFIMITFLPLAMLLIYAIISMANISVKYDRVVKNITAVNAFNIGFKEDVDYAMYQLVIGSAQFQEADKSVKIEDPYQTIQEVRGKFHVLYDVTSSDSNKRRINRIQKSLNVLEDRIDEIRDNLKQPGNYDKNIYMLNTNVYISTDLIQDYIQEYIYYEVAYLEETRNQISTEFDTVLNINIYALIALICITAIVAKVISDSITKPIESLCSTTKQVAKGDFSIRARAAYGKEVSTLVNSFNSMVEQIGNLVEDVKVEQLNLRAMELKLLQAQINPHFLYNTLDTIIWLAEANQTEQVVKMVTSLSDFFRTTLSKGKDFITIKEEESQVRSYLEIQQFRYRDILEYEILIPSELYMHDILKLTLQPIVENALYHGIKNKRGMGHIEISGELSENKIFLTVRDNGIGMTKEELEHLRLVIQGVEDQEDKSGFGIYNVVQRIQLNYGKEYGAVIDSTYGEGTSVRIIIPAIKK